MNKDKLSEKFIERELVFTLLNIKNSSLLSFLPKSMKLKTDQEILRLSENNMLIFKTNTKRHNLRNQDSKVIALPELVKIELKLIDSSENLTLSKLIMQVLKTNKSNF